MKEDVFVAQSINSVVLVGRLTRDPELRVTQSSGISVTTFTVAVDRRVAQGKEKQADFVSVVAWRGLAESVAKYLGKGRLVGVQGRIQTRSYETDSGDKRYVTEVVAEDVQFLDKPKDEAAADDDVLPDDIPF